MMKFVLPVMAVMVAVMSCDISHACSREPRKWRL